MPIIFYAAPMSSASPVTCALRELEVPHERVNVDLSKGDQRKAEYLALNPNGKVPLLIVDGTPLFEAVAIMQWLGDTYGVEKKLWPALGEPARLEALSWTTWAYVTFGSGLVRLFRSTNERFAKENSAVAADAAKQDLQALLGLLDDRFEKRQHLLGAQYSLADLILACSVNYAKALGVPTDAHPALEAWLKRCLSRPALQAPWD